MRNPKHASPSDLIVFVYIVCYTYNKINTYIRFCWCEGTGSNKNSRIPHWNPIRHVIQHMRGAELRKSITAPGYSSWNGAGLFQFFFSIVVDSVFWYNKESELSNYVLFLFFKRKLTSSYFEYQYDPRIFLFWIKSVFTSEWLYSLAKLNSFAYIQRISVKKCFPYLNANFLHVYSEKS